jgi:hypothetical protein
VLETHIEHHKIHLSRQRVTQRLVSGHLAITNRAIGLAPTETIRADLQRIETAKQR